jgi:hypothetical protein
MTESIEVRYTRTVEERFWFRSGETYIVEYSKDRTIRGRFIGIDGDALIFREEGPKKRLHSVRVKALRRAELV